MQLKQLAWFCVSLLAASVALAESAKPKYGPEATPLSQSHDYFQKNPAPDYWALAPYYAAQFNDKACGIASVTMLVNGGRKKMRLTANDELVTQEGLLKKLKPIWSNAVGEKGNGVTLDRLGKLVEEALTASGLKWTKVEIIHAQDASSKTAERLHQILLENERSDSDFLLINFVQGIYTGDADVGHIAPIGAYDATNRKVLIMDPDRRWYEPYWVSEETFLKGMVTKDQHSGNEWRGYVWVRLKDLK